MDANHELVDPEEEQDRDGAVGGVDIDPEEHENVDVDVDVDVDDDDDDEESNEEQEEEYSSDEEEEDDDYDFDVDDEDLAIVDDIVDALEGTARLDGSLFIGPSVLREIGLLTEPGMATLVDELTFASASEQSWDHLVGRVTVDVEDPVHDVNVARRITRVLNCLDLESLKEFALVEEDAHDDDDDENDDENDDALHPWKPLVVDHYITWMTTAECFTHPELLSTVRLECFGYDPNVWDNFVARYASIGEVWITIGEVAALYPNCATHATALAKSLRNLSRLSTLRVIVHAAGGACNLLSCVCHGLGSSLTQVERLDVFVLMQETELCDACTKDSELALHEIGNVLAFAASLKHVTISFNAAAKDRLSDVGVLFDQLRSSGSIEKVGLTRFEVKAPTQTRFHKGFLARARSQLEPSDAGPLPTMRSKPSIANQSIKSLVLENCSIGKSYSSAFAFFDGIEDVTLTVDDWRPSDAQLSWSSQRPWTILFRTHPQLKSFAVGIVNSSAASIYKEGILAALVASLHRAPALHDLTVCTNSSPRSGRNVSLPSLDRLFRTCNGKLTLQHHGVNDRTTASICAGLQTTTSLRDVHLTVTGMAMRIQTVASILSALTENQSVTSFHGTFLFDSLVPVGVLNSVLDDLFSSNSALESFGLDLLWRQRRDDTYFFDETPPNYTALVVAPIARALARNRTLKVLLLKGLVTVDPRSFALLSGMLQTNVTLERIKFHDNVEDSEAKDEIERLLTLNRQKRRCVTVPVPHDDRTSRRLDDPKPHLLGEVVLLPERARDPLPEGDPVPPPASGPESSAEGVSSSVLERLATDRRSLFVSPSDYRGPGRASPPKGIVDDGEFDGPDGADGGFVWLSDAGNDGPNNGGFVRLSGDSIDGPNNDGTDGRDNDIDGTQDGALDGPIEDIAGSD